ncbi:winged helix-turn-helix transcriptional regulator [bacterium]|nr:winged helix-turn-helix transcriptional regulator [bacterium]
MKNEIILHEHNDSRDIETVSGILSQQDSFESVAEVFKLLSDTSRMRIFWLLCHAEECVVNIAALMDMTMPAVSHHLKALKAGRLLVSRRVGKEVYYRAAENERCLLLHLVIERIMSQKCPS